MKEIENKEKEIVEEIIKKYTDIDEGFVMTRIPVNMLPNVARMVRHVARGNMPANVVGIE